MYHFTFIYFKFYCLGTESVKVLIFITVFIIYLYYLNILASSVNFVVLLFFLAFSGHLGMSSCAGSTRGLLWELSISFCLVSYLSPVIYPYTGNFPVIRYFDYLFKFKKKKKVEWYCTPNLTRLGKWHLCFDICLSSEDLWPENGAVLYNIFFPESSLHTAAV